jgi:tetratricopeptide (TPR) repeat protein
MNRLYTPARGPGTVWLLAIFLTCAWGFAAPADAGGSTTRKAAAKAEVQKAQVHYKLGRFDQALEAYSRAYELFNAPALLFNIGQCHKNLRDFERAIFFFEGYLREESNPNPRTRALAQELIAESRVEIERRRPAVATASKAAVATASKAAATASSGSASSVAAMFGAPAAAPSASPLLLDRGEPSPTVKPLTHRWWFWTTLGAGAIILAGGALAYYASGQGPTFQSGTVGVLDRR